MSSSPGFDFGKLLATATDAAAPAGPEPCIVGVAWNDEGIGIVALAPVAATSKVIRAYVNLAIGPFEDDWIRIAPLIQNIPLLFYDKVPLVFLCDFSKQVGRKYPIEVEFLRAFGKQARVLTHDEVESWASIAMPSIAAPKIPACDSWSIKPIRVAAETTLYAGNQIALAFSGRPSDQGGLHNDA